MTTRKYCNVCHADVTDQPHLSLNCDWDNAKWMSRYTPRDVCLCEKHAQEYIDRTMDKDAYNQWVKDKQEYDEREKELQTPSRCIHCDDCQ